MALCPEHQLYHDAMWAIDGFMLGPIRIIGVQEIFGLRPDWPQLTWNEGDKGNATLRELFLSKGLTDVKEIDFHDTRAEIQWDLNKPVPTEWHDTAHTLIDIGSIEHVADSIQVLKNYIHMAKVGGFIAIHTPVKGYCGHGLHTFSPEFIIETFKQNGCEVVYLTYCADGGKLVDIPKNAWWEFPADPNIIIWLVVRKLKCLGEFVTIQQSCY